MSGEPYGGAPNPGVHNPLVSSYQWGNIPQQELDMLRSKLVESIIQTVVRDITGVLLPGPAGQQLADWAIGVLEGIGSAGEAIFALISGVGGTVINDVVIVLRTVQQIIDAIANAMGLAGTGHTPAEVLAALSSIPGSVISGATAIEQSIIDTICNALGHPGTGHTLLQLLGYMSNIPGSVVSGVTTDWQAALDALHLSNPTALVQQIPQSIPALVRDVEGGLSAVGGGLTRGPDGAISFIEDGLTHLVQQADQAILSLPQIAEQILHASNTISAGVAPSAAAVANPGVADVVAVGQVAHTALASAIEQAGATVVNDIVAGAGQLGGVVSGTVTQIEGAANVFAGGVASGVGQLENSVAGFFTNLFNSWTGGAAPAASAHDVAVIAAAASKTIAETHTVSIETINSVLPSFYGGGGAGGLNKSVPMSGTLPAGFSSASTIAVASAIYNTVATTDTQTVVGAWSVTDTHAQYLFLRANSGFTTYVYAKLQSNTPFTGAGNCEIGCVVAGTRHVFSTFALPGNFISGSAYTLAAVSNVLTVTGPGGLDASYTDAGVVSQVGSSYRYGGFGTDGYSREIDSWTGAGTTTYVPPSWMASTDSFDFVDIGGGGGGGGVSNFLQYSHGGVGGAWNTATIVRSTVTGSITVTVGAGGAGGAGNSTGGTGGASAIVVPGYGTITSSGGAGGTVANGAASIAYGGSPGNTTLSNAAYYGGATQTALGSAGNPPGGGGVGGYVDTTLFISGNATAGAPGAVWITANDRSCPGSLGFWAFYDSAVTGPAQAYVATSESTSSATYTDLATTTDQVTVNIGSSGLALVFISANMGAGGSMSFAVSGATTIAASDAYAAPGGYAFQVPGLGLGPTNFKLKAKSASGSVSFRDRRIEVTPL